MNRKKEVGECSAPAFPQVTLFSRNTVTRYNSCCYYVVLFQSQPIYAKVVTGYSG